MRRRQPGIPLTPGWPAHAEVAVRHAAALAHAAIIRTRDWCANSPIERVGLAGRLDRAQADLAALREEVRIKDVRMTRLEPHRRPHYTPTERRAILELRAAQGWSLSETARRFLVTPEAVSTWAHAPVSGEAEPRRPANRFPDIVRHLVQRLKTLCPVMGRRRIAETLARAGLHLAATTVTRMLDEPTPVPAVVPPPETENRARMPVRRHGIKATRPEHVWHIDLTLVPTSGGFYIPWLPFAFLQSWPFCWWVLAVVDQFTRAVVGFAVYPKQPTSAQVCADLDRLIVQRGVSPKHLISDRGCKFDCAHYRDWCAPRTPKIRTRFGAVGKKGSIAFVERFFLSLKSECLRRVTVPVATVAVQTEISLYVHWYNAHRPHQSLAGRTPLEVHHGTPSANEARRFEPRIGWPPDSPCAAPRVPPRGPPGIRLELSVAFLEGRRHLPIIHLDEAA